MKKIIGTENAPKAIGPYSQAVKFGNALYVSGQLPVNPQTGVIECLDIKGQAKQSLENVKAILEEAGYSLNDVVKTTCFITDMTDFAKINEVYSEYFVEEYPARSCGT